MYYPRAALWHVSIIEVMADFIGKIINVDVASPDNQHQQSVNRASTEHQQSINRASTILGVASCMIQRLCYSIHPQSTYWQTLCAKKKVTWSQPQSENECQQSVNDFVCCILYHSRAVLWHLFIIKVMAAFIGKIVKVDVASADNERQQSVNRPSTKRQQSID